MIVSQTALQKEISKLPSSLEFVRAKKYRGLLRTNKELRNLYRLETGQLEKKKYSTYLNQKAEIIGWFCVIYGWMMIVLSNVISMIPHREGKLLSERCRRFVQCYNIWRIFSNWADGICGSRMCCAR